jgi:Tol biopolymer transport system component
LVAASLLLALMMPAEAAFSGKNGKIAFSSNKSKGKGVDNRTGDFEIFTIDPDGTGLEQLTFNRADDYAPEYSADGERITFTSDREGSSRGIDDIFKMEADGSDQENLTKTPRTDDSFSVWSPNGRWIAFTSFRGDNFEVYRMKADGSAQRNLTENPADDSLPAWSPGGKRIAFQSDRTGNFEIFKMKANGSAKKNLTKNSAANDVLPEWSPDGRRMAFASDRDSTIFILDIFTMKKDGSSQQNLTETPRASECFSAWSPDGRQIAFDRDWGRPASGCTDNENIFRMKADGSSQKKVTGTRVADDYAPAWQPREDEEDS